MSDSEAYTIDWQGRSVWVPRAQSDRDWDAVVSVIRDHRLSKVTAASASDWALHRLSGIPHVTSLAIGGSASVTDDGLMQLARMPQLEELELGGRSSPITDRGLGVLHHLGQMRRFQACWTPGISDTGVAALVHCAHLQDVNLLGTKTGDGAIRALTGKLQLRRFQSGRGVTDDGLALLHEVPNFRTWQGGNIRYGLMRADAEPNFLLIDGPFTDAGLTKLSELQGLFAVSLFWHSSAFTSEGVAALKQLPNLGFLGCQNSHCDDRAMRHIAEFPRLRVLMGQGAIAGDDGFEALSGSRTLEYIWGRKCPNLTGRGFAALAAMPSLKGIAVSCRNVDDQSLSRLADFPALREIMPMDVSDAGFRHLGRCENLEAVWCMYCRETGDDATRHLTGLSRLRTYYAGATNITDLSLAMLGQMGLIEHLEFWKCAGLTDEGIGQLAGLPRLRELSLGALPGVSRKAAAAFPGHVRVKYSE